MSSLIQIVIIHVSTVRGALRLRTMGILSVILWGGVGLGPVQANLDGLQPHHPRRRGFFVPEVLLELKGREHPVALKSVDKIVFRGGVASVDDFVGHVKYKWVMANYQTMPTLGLIPGMNNTDLNAGDLPRHVSLAFDK